MLNVMACVPRFSGQPGIEVGGRQRDGEDREAGHGRSFAKQVASNRSRFALNRVGEFRDQPPISASGSNEAAGGSATAWRIAAAWRYAAGLGLPAFLRRRVPGPRTCSGSTADGEQRETKWRLSLRKERLPRNWLSFAPKDFKGL